MNTCVGKAGCFDQAVGDVDTESVDAEVEPEAQDGAEFVVDGGVVPIEVGLLRGEQVQIPLAGGSVGVGGAGPGRAAEDGFPVVGRLLAGRSLAGAEVEAGAGGGAGAVAQCLEEPGVVVGAVVGHDVEDDPRAEAVRVLDQGDGVGQLSEHGVHGAVVGDVVSGVCLRGGVERRKPYGVDAQVAQVGQAAADAGQVAYAVAIGVGVGVGEAAGVDLVDHRVAPPAGSACGGGIGGARFGACVQQGVRCHGVPRDAGRIAVLRGWCAGVRHRARAPRGGRTRGPGAAGRAQLLLPPAVRPVTRCRWTR
ncbi:hypothetical protein SAMN05216499_13838 [Actinacidiphila paucisporea]|uniref:Uncharacterized protein n=1 Tax=Actinacidiphila paucisporea TaxID=310782 RepID=A0A1M7QNN5_9ACTN|nr:hypothetical protein SAMN05216499_13838 [Actinacidiphila paucisporea]